MFEIFLISRRASSFGLLNPHQDVIYFMLPLIIEFLIFNGPNRARELGKNWSEY